MIKKRGDLPVTILRPSIVICCAEDPFPGWIDSLAGSGGIIVAVSTGILKFMHGRGDNILDLVPCDLVSNQILVQTCVTAM